MEATILHGKTVTENSTKDTAAERMAIALKDELFCVRYELGLLAGHVLQGRLERWIEGFCSPEIESDHVQRYEFASRIVNGCVLDIACGTGRGTRLLAEAKNVSEVHGYDIDPVAIQYAQIRNRHARAHFETVNIAETADRAQFDAIVCFETIEHVDKPELFLRRLTELLKPEGRLLISTPVSAKALDQNPNNVYHVQEWGCDEFRTLLASIFKIHTIHFQYRQLLLKARLLGRIRGNQPRLARQSCWKTFQQVDAAQAKWRRSWIGFQILECSAL